MIGDNKWKKKGRVRCEGSELKNVSQGPQRGAQSRAHHSQNAAGGCWPSRSGHLLLSTFLVAELDRVARARRTSASRSCNLLDLWMGKAKMERWEEEQSQKLWEVLGEPEEGPRGVATCTWKWRLCRRGGKKLLPLGSCRGPGCFPSQVLGEDQQPREVSRRQITGGDSRGLQSQQSPWWWWRKEHVSIPHIRLPALGRVPAGPGGGRFGPSCVCKPTVLPFLRQGQEAPSRTPTLDLCNPARSSPMLPSQAWPGSRQGAGCCSRTMSGTGLTGWLPVPLPEGQGWSSPACPWDCSDTLAQGSFHAGAGFSASASHKPVKHQQLPRPQRTSGCNSPVSVFLHGILILFSIALLDWARGAGQNLFKSIIPSLSLCLLNSCLLSGMLGQQK